MIILAVDPGYERLGLAIIEKRAGKEVLLYSGCFTTSAKENFEKRLFMLGQEVKSLIKKWKPQAVAIEKLYLATNQKTAMRVSEARGVLLYEAVSANIPVVEFTPLQIKIAITSYGRADKKQIANMVRKLITFPNKKTTDDEFDAVAIGLTFFAQQRNYRGLSTDQN
ncbi:MAG: crossover junction endodeoxyribonuclease RuvC [Candidatus Lloydbacteria bacterium RIFCSPHIGHO2_01_FULL_41_20]|uniref:Crossover junction endodeoxyribonuclease RuvC n=1 Tax=Candidatus Lloydbacteria bacterium RIFCSPHIGHO2_01_FULL_41_20 TaxID=1798657 RepID=A0A1G2CU61_9BACT|nr:MAG: crossover junction endodeoxyribonuclease RuvC [Candidatus Lloydbacteria bacterium RIFCSPHIGHO2_01_FULL_41_20]